MICCVDEKATSNNNLKKTFSIYWSEVNVCLEFIESFGRVLKNFRDNFKDFCILQKRKEEEGGKLVGKKKFLFCFFGLRKRVKRVYVLLFLISSSVTDSAMEVKITPVTAKPTTKGHLHERRRKKERKKERKKKSMKLVPTLRSASRRRKPKTEKTKKNSQENVVSFLSFGF